MAKESKNGNASYSDVVSRLEDVVKRLEAGELSLEDSLKAFEEGIGLVKKGEEILNAAEQRIEQLLEQDGDLTEAPLHVEGAPRAKAASAPARPSQEEEDVPF